MRNFTLATAFVFVTSMAHAEVYLGAGMISHNSGKAATSATSGSTPLFSDTYAQIALTGIFQFSDSWLLSPEFRYSVTHDSAPDGGSSTRVYQAGVRVMFPVGRPWDFHLGPGVLFYSMSGDGGTISLNNGSGMTTFGLPSSSVTTRMIYLDPGFGWQWGRFRTEISIYIADLFSSSRRSVSPALSASWRLL